MTVPGSGGGVTDPAEEGVLGHDVRLTSLMSECHTLLSPLTPGLRVTESVGAGGHWPESGSNRAGGRQLQPRPGRDNHLQLDFTQD